jgi:hypothetical protein
MIKEVQAPRQIKTLIEGIGLVEVRMNLNK